MAVPQMLWRRVLQATIDTLDGESRGQYDIRLARPNGIAGFFDGLAQTPNGKGGYSVKVLLEPAPGVGPESVEVAYIGPQSARNDWRITSQRPNTAYPLWRKGTGLLPTTSAGDDFVLLLRDPVLKYHARWLRKAERPRLPMRVASELAKGNAGVLSLDPGEWDEVVALLDLAVPASAPAPAPAPTPAPAPGPTPAPTSPPVTAPPVKPKTEPVPGDPGETYRPEDTTTEPDPKTPEPFTVDPDVVDRGRSGHKGTQNALADHLEAKGLQPLSPRPLLDPPFDLAWEAGGVLHVVEVKSVTTKNEEKQLRLALGQVLRYCYLLGLGGREVQPVIALEREPSDQGWIDMCAAIGVRLSWPESFGDLTG